MNPPESSAPAVVSKNFRRLQGNELVSVGDFVADEQRGLEPWEGPNGFRADSFVKAIYRRNNGQSPATKKLREMAASPSPSRHKRALAAP